MIVDLADPRVRSIAVAAVARTLTMGASLCHDRSRSLAVQAVDDAWAAIGNHAITEGEVPPDHAAT
jgi:hypothetical protein